MFNGGKGSCSYGDKCKFSYDTAPGRATMLSPGKSTGGKFSPNQKKQIVTMMSSQMKRAFKSAADSKGKKQKVEEYGDDDDNLATIIASCMIGSLKCKKMLVYPYVI